MPCLNCRRGHRDLYDCSPRVMRAAQHESCCDHDDNERRRSSSISRSTDRSRLRRLSKIRIRSSWLCLFYLLSFTTHWNARPHSAITPARSFILAYALEQGVVDQHETEEVENPRIRQQNTTAEQLFFPAEGVAPTAQKVPPNKEKLTLNQILYRAGKRGLGGGVPGAIAGAMQVLSLMWLRTIINYQCRYGTTFSQALRTLLHDGGVPRLYRGLSFALVQAPLARFVSTAANDGIESLLANLLWTQDWGAARTTVVASIVVGIWRMMLMPIDTMKTVLQVDSFEGFRSLMRRVRAGHIGVLYSGAFANAISAILGHYPWFYTFNLLSGSEWLRTILPSQLLRNAGIGIAASVVADTVVNAMRVIKTTKQSLGSKQTASYSDTVRIILAADGWTGLFGRGLRTRIFANALQSIVFTVVWRGLRDTMKHRSESAADEGVKNARKTRELGSTASNRVPR